MKDNVVSLVKSEPTPKEKDWIQEQLISSLKELLKRAEEGEVVGIALVAETKDQTSIDTSYYVRSVFRTLGGIAILQKELLEMIED
jgi:hypothetical protein